MCPPLVFGAQKKPGLDRVNVRSILVDGRLVDLEILGGSHEIDVLCITETWLTNLSINICINGFQHPIRRARDRCGKRGGGVAIFVRNGIPRPMQAVTLDNQLEIDLMPDKS